MITTLFSSLLLFFLPLGVIANPPLEEKVNSIELSQLSEDPQFKHLDGQPVCIRGFLVQRALDGKWVLSPSPNKHSCCGNSTQVIPQQVILEGSFAKEKENQALELKGTFHFDPQYTSEGKMVQLYRLSDGQEVISTSSGSTWIWWLEVFAITSVFGFFVRRRFFSSK